MVSINVLIALVVFIKNLHKCLTFEMFEKSCYNILMFEKKVFLNFFYK